MNIDLQRITIRQVVESYLDSGEGGVVGYGGRLDIRPPYQREFVYGPKERHAVIDSVLNRFPLNTIYWAIKPDGNFEVLDGQQRIISICQYVTGVFSYTGMGFTSLSFHNLPEDLRNQILDYKLLVYFCEGEPDEKLKWFKVINIAAKPLKDQELRNAVFTGPWLSDAKAHFSRTNGPASLYREAGDLLKGSAIRQDYLETVLSWISNGGIEDYMDAHAKDENAGELWVYFQKVVDWVKRVFPVYRKEMAGLPWGELFNEHGNKDYDPGKLEGMVASMMADTEVQRKSGIYHYLITGDERKLSLRAFDTAQRREAYERQNGYCIHCGSQFEIAEMEADHITPWSQGGRTIHENCQMLCRDCNRRKSNK